MKYLYQFGIIVAVCAIAELLYQALGLPIPTSVYGLVIMLLLLICKVIRVEQIEQASGFLLGIMPILFISPAVSIMDTIGEITDKIVPLLIVTSLSSLLTILVTGWVAQWLVRNTKKHQEGENQ